LRDWGITRLFSIVKRM